MPDPQSDFFREGKSACVYPTASCFLAKDVEKPVICKAAAPGAKNPAPGQVSGKCIRSNSMINNKINSILQAKGVGIQKGQSSHSSWGYTTHSFPGVSWLRHYPRYKHRVTVVKLLQIRNKVSVRKVIITKWIHGPLNSFLLLPLIEKKIQTPCKGLPIIPENLSVIQFSWKNVALLNNVPGTFSISLFQVGE